MTDTNDGGPAFPHVAHENTVGVVEGATLREAVREAFRWVDLPPSPDR